MTGKEDTSHSLTKKEGMTAKEEVTQEDIYIYIYIYMYIYIHTYIHSIDPSFCHTAVACETGHNAI